MKVLINVTELLAAYPELDLVAIQDDLTDFGAEFTEKEAGGISYLEVVCDNLEDFNYAFENTGHVTDIDAYIIDDEADYPDFDATEDDAEYPDYNDVETEDEIPDYDSVDECDLTEDELYEKKKNDCCPKKKVKNNCQYVSLSEALGLTKKKTYHKASLNELIDSISGKRPQRSIIEKALEKAKKNNKVNEARKHLGEKRYKMIMEALEQRRPTLHQNISINKKKMEEYTTEELQAILEKVNSQIEKLKEQMNGINETDALAKFEKELQNKQKMHTILEDEITYRKSYLKEADDENDFAKLFPEMKPEGEEKSDDKSEESDEKADEKDDEQNPDEDEEIELNAVVITLASEDDANNLKQDLVDAGVPEDVIEIAPVGEDEDEEETEEDEESSEEEPAEEESDKKEESLRVKGKKMNEADDDEETEQGDDEAAADAEADEEKSEEEEKTEGEYKLTLTDTDYIEELADVLENIWGMEKSEFEELIGGEIVTKDDEESDDDEKKESDDESDEDKEKDDDDITPEELFKGL